MTVKQVIDKCVVHVKQKYMDTTGFSEYMKTYKSWYPLYRWDYPWVSFP